MKKLYIVMVAMLLCSDIFAQNNKLNQTVQVTNAYEGKLREVEKYTLATCVPDSIYHFDLNFDYSGFENPYLGTDDFNPFKTELDIAPRQLDFKKFYMKAGAGYTLAPTFDMVWTPNPSGRFKAGFYVSHDSYFGAMYDTGVTTATATAPFSPDKSMEGKTRGAALLRWDTKKAFFILDAGYDGVFSRLGDSSQETSSYNGGSARLSVKSNSDPGLSKFKYGFDAEYAFGSRMYDENVFCADAFLDFFPGKFGFGADVDFNVTSGSPRQAALQRGEGKYSAFSIAARPRFSLSTRRVSLIAGVGLYFAGSADANVKDFGNLPKYPIFPYIDFSWKAVPEHLDLYAVMDARQKVWGQRENSLGNRFLIDDLSRSLVKDLYLRAGARGSIARQVQYDLNVGWQNLLNAPVFGVQKALFDGGLLPVIVHKDVLESVYVSLNADADFDAVNFGVNVKYTHYYDSAPQQQTQVDIAPPAWNAGAYFGYNFRKRIQAKVGADYLSQYRCALYTADSFVNLYAELRLRFTPRAGFYLRGENLLGQKCQYIPLLARKGICATGGIILNF